MKKYLFILAAAAALAACSKTEVVPVNSDADVEITFLTAPLTKALGTGQSAFSTDNVFQSAAFYDVNDFVYGSTTAETFIKPTTVKYFTSVWKAADATGNAVTYYWPKDGGELSFFSWSFNKSTLTYEASSPTVDINKANGVVLTDYYVGNNEDFMVAEPALNQTGNKTTYTHEGVPTLFKHKLAQIVFQAKTNADYTVAPYKQKFTITRIYFEQVAEKATYKQYVSETVKDQWTVADNDLVYYLTLDGIKHVVQSGNATTVTSDAVDFYIPQSFTADNQKLIVEYTVSRASDAGNVSSKYTESVSLKTLLGAIECGKKYTITLNFGLDQIYWDPAVEDWTEVNSGSIDIK
jgi:hypothetical protein